MLDSMAERYSVLPSQILAQGTTLDICIFDTAHSYRRHLEDRKQKPAEQFYSESDLLTAVNRVRNDTD
jgi:hypothetical protein